MAPGTRAPVAPVKKKEKYPKRTDEPKPTQQMKKFHWTKADTRSLDDTIWPKLSDKNVHFDIKQFESMFHEKKRAVKKSAADDGDGEGKKKPKKAQAISLISDANRCNNVEISLSRFKATNQDIKNAILAMDETMLNPDKLTALLKIIPTSDELSAVEAYDGDVALLAKTEKFFKTISSIPMCQKRLELFLFKQFYQEQMDDLTANLRMVQRALQGIKESKGLKSLFQIILAMGNYLNAGSRNGGAYGFKLNTLGKLRSTRSVDNSTNLLEYIVNHCRNNKADVLQFKNDLAAVPSACAVESQFFMGEVSKFTAKFNLIKSACDRFEDSKTDAFKPIMTKFYEKNFPSATKLKDDSAKARDDCAKVCVAYAEKKDMAWEEFFAIFADLLNEWTMLESGIDRKLELAQKAERAAAAKAKRGVAKQTSAAKPDKSSDLSENLLRSLKGNKSDILASVDRLRKKQATQKSLRLPQMAAVLAAKSKMTTNKKGVGPPLPSRPSKKNFRSSLMNSKKGKNSTLSRTLAAQLSKLNQK
jgi:diaphanous 1